MPPTELTDNDVLTVEEAASILRISRNAAYALTREWRSTGGQTGLPCIALGRSLRVPRVALHRMLVAPPDQARTSTIG